MNAVRGGIVAVAIVLLVSAPGWALQDYAAANWSDDFSALFTDFGGITAGYHDVMIAGGYPVPGQPMALTISSVWPVVFVHARFTTDTTNWPRGYRGSARDLAVMYFADASHYQQTFGKYVLSASYDRPSEFIREAEDPHHYHLIRELRGKPIHYTSTSSAGLGAADYTVESVSTMGLSCDGHTVIIYSDPEHISDHLRDRKMVVGIRDDGDRLYFEVRGICLCKDRWLFRDEMLKRIAQTMTYIGHQMYGEFCDAPSLAEIEHYLARVRATGAGQQ